MPEEIPKGVEPIEEPPSSTTGVTDPGPPPETFEGEIVQQDGQRYVPLDALKAMRQDLTTKNTELGNRVNELETQPEPEPEPVPDFNWDEFKQPASPPQPPPSPPPQPQQPNGAQPFQEQYQDYMQENPFGAVSMVVGSMMQQQENMRNQAKNFVPDFDVLDTHGVTDADVQALAANPYAMKALIAKTRGRPTPPSPPPQPPIPQQNPQQLIQQGRQQILDNVGKVAGVTGEGTGGGMPQAGPTDEWEISAEDKAYYIGRGYKEEEIPDVINRLVARKKSRGEY